MLYSIVKDPSVSADELNHDLETISVCAHQWKMEYTTFKSRENAESAEFIFQGPIMDFILDGKQH